jgi:UDP-N-acetylglucosamine 2-epimerase (non-hydrolysing)
LPVAQDRGTLREHELRPGQYGVVTLHRPSNVDNRDTFQRLLEVLMGISRRIPLLFPMHPRTVARLKTFGLGRLLEQSHGMKVVPPLGYLDCLALTSQAKFIVTDSGGLQEESTALGIPCLTVRPNTERPITVSEGTSTLVGSNTDLLAQCLESVLDGTYKQGRCPTIWDGHAAERIAGELVGHED